MSKVVYGLMALVALCIPVRSGASDAVSWHSLYLSELQQVEAVLKAVARETQVEWPVDWPYLHVLPELSNANARATGGCYTESAHAGRTYRVEQPPRIFVTAGLLHVVHTFAAENFMKFAMAHEMAHLERRLRAHPRRHCAAEAAADANGGSVQEELRADRRGVELLCLLGEDGVSIGLEGIELLYRFNLGFIGHRAYPSRAQRLEQIRSMSCLPVPTHR